MEKLFIREVVAVWAFDQQNKAVWKCSDVGKLKLSQDGETTKKKGSRGETIFQLNRNKSARLTFETNIWGVDLISALSGSKTEKATLYEPIQAPFVESWVIEPSHLRDGFITLTQRPCDNSTISLHKLSADSSIDTAYDYNGITATSDSFSYNPKIIVLSCLQEFREATSLRCFMTIVLIKHQRRSIRKTNFQKHGKLKCLFLHLDLAIQIRFVRCG